MNYWQLSFITSTPIKCIDCVALFGHLFKMNKQVHDFQYVLVREYLKRKDISEHFVLVHDVIFESPNAISLDRAVNAFYQESLSIRKELYKFLIIVTMIDGFYDTDEGEFFKILLKHEHDSEMFTALEDACKKCAEELRKKLKEENAAYRYGRNTNVDFDDNRHSAGFLSGVSQDEYIDAIEKCRYFAHEDFAIIKPISNEIISSARGFLIQVKEKIDQLQNSEKERETADIIAKLANTISTEVISASKKYKEQIERKEAATEDFTVVLVGRTKAGKSTMKAVLTGTGKDEIGKGGQRTTLINYIYEWNHLRIIDTPGIGAAEDADEKDKEIAERALSEADVVCYLSPSDGVPKDTKKFITEIVNTNKPVMILVNYKSNIRDEDELEDFMDDPTDWKTEEGPNSLRGYFEPIMREAEKEGYQQMISYYPVFLLAALMSDEDKYAQYASVLRKNSGVDEFLDALKNIVAEQGIFLRSKTIIDDTIYNCIEWKNYFSNSLKQVKDIYSNIKNFDSTFKQMQKLKEKCVSNIQSRVYERFKRLATIEAHSFAEEHYEDASDELGKKWQAYCSDLHIDEFVNGVVEEETSEFVVKIRDMLDDYSVDFAFEFSDKMIGGDIIRDTEGKLFDLSINFKDFWKICSNIGAVLSIVPGLHIVGGSIAILSAVFAGKCKDKKSRQEEAIKTLYDALNDSVKKFASKSIANIGQTMNEKLESMLWKIRSSYASMGDSLYQIIADGENVCIKLDMKIKSMNEALADRILKYIAPDCDAEIHSITREYGKRMEIVLVADKSLTFNTSKLVGLIKDEVIIKTVKQENNYDFF